MDDSLLLTCRYSLCATMLLGVTVQYADGLCDPIPDIGALELEGLLLLLDKSIVTI